MIRTLLSDDLPRHRGLAVILAVIAVTLAIAPFVFPGARALNAAAMVCIFIVLVASYDLLLGYTGIVSFAHAMFCGIGAYGVAIALHRHEASWGALAVGVLCAVALSTALALLIGFLTLRVRAMAFAMITLAVASAFMTMASQLSDLTGGEDGLIFKVPPALAPDHSLLTFPGLGVDVNGTVLTYYLVFGAALVMFLLLLRVVNSPFGKVLQAIRENPQRAEAVGYKPIVYRCLSTVIAAVFATLAGALLALWLRYNGPSASMSLEIMLDILLIVVIGGMGSMYGAVVGSALFVVVQNYLQSVMGALADQSANLGLLGALVSPDRWLLWLGLLFVFSVYWFPNGVVGRLRRHA